MCAIFLTMKNFMQYPEYFDSEIEPAKVGFSSQEHRKIIPGRGVQYTSYQDIRGEAAKEICNVMGIFDECGIGKTGYLVELRTACDHVAVSAHGKETSKTHKIYADGRTEIIFLDQIKRQAKHIVCDPNQKQLTMKWESCKDGRLKCIWSDNAGSVETKVAGWSYERDGYHELPKRISFERGKLLECLAICEKNKLIRDMWNAVKSGCENYRVFNH